MNPIIDLAPGAEENALAVEIAECLRDNMDRSPRKVADFRALRASVLMVAQDRAESFTLRFDHGRLTIHDGSVGIPSVTFCGDAEALRRLTDFPLTRFFRLPLAGPLTREGRETWQHLLGLLVRGDLKVYGLVAHPRTVFHLLRVLSAHR
ncbi:MAG: hypothetical protein QM820_13805 [Minicystis sp.]